MRNIFTVLLLIVFAGLMQAQEIILQEDFEEGTIPETWTETSDNETGWEVTQELNTFYFPVPEHTWVAYTQTTFIENGTMDYLITPILDLTSYNNCVLNFASFFNGNYGQTAFVEINTGSEWIVIEQMQANEEWQNLSIDLASYCGNSNIQLAFHSNGSWGSGWAIDDISVEASSSNPIPPENFIATVTASDVVLAWESPQTNLQVTGYRIYRDYNELIQLDSSSNTYTDQNLYPNDYSYYVTALYGAWESETTDTLTVTVLAEGNLAPNSLYVNTSGLATWSEPITAALFYDNLDNGDSNWNVVNNGTLEEAVWTLYDQPYPNNYYMPEASSGNVFAADSDITCPIDTELILNHTVDCSGHDNIFLEFDTHYSPTVDTQAHVLVSNDAGESWNNVHSMTQGALVQHHQIIDISSYAANSSQVMVKFHSIYPTSAWYWVLDNIKISSIATQRDLTGYNVYLDDTLISENQANKHYQFEDLTVGNEYNVGVSAVYNNEESDVISYDFTFQLMVTVPENLKYSIDGSDVHIHWADDNLETTAYKIYRDGTEIAEIDNTQKTYVDTELENGTYEYSVSALFASVESEQTETITAEIIGGILNFPTNVEIDNRGNASWEQPNIFFEDFERGTNLWTVNNYNTLGNYWQMASEPFEQGYQMPGVDISGNIMVANGTNGLVDSDLVLEYNVDCMNYTNVALEFDSNFLPFNLGDYGRVSISNDYGVSWIEVLEYPSDYAISAHETIDISEYLPESGKLLVKFYCYYLTNSGYWAIDNVKVSSTQEERTVQGYNLYLDGTLVENVNTLSYNFDNLVIDQEYTAGISTVYSNGESPTLNYEFTYSHNSVLNLDVELSDYNNATISWEQPLLERNSRSLSGYKVIRNDQVIAELETDNLTYQDNNLSAGSQVYELVALYDTEEAPAVTKEVTVFINAPQNLTGNITNNATAVELNWQEPEVGGPEITEEIIYDNGSATMGYSPRGLTYATRFEPSAPCKLLSVKYHISDISSGSFDLELYDWGVTEPEQTVLHSVTDIWGQQNTWVNVDVSEDDIYFDDQFVVGFTSSDENTYITCDLNDVEAGRCWTYQPSTSRWFRWNFTYFIRATVQYENGRTEEIDVNPQSLYNREITSYKVYRNNEEIAEVNTTSYIDESPISNINNVYHVTAIYGEGVESSASETITIDDATPNNNNDIEPVSTQLTNYPNPFNPETTISFNIDDSEKVSLDIYNIKGQKVITLCNELLNVGSHSYAWNGIDENNKQVASGIYFARLKTARTSKMQKMILMK